MADNTELRKELDYRSIALAGKVFDDLEMDEVSLLMNKLADEGEWDSFLCLFFALLGSALRARKPIPSEATPAETRRVITQEQISAALRDGVLAEDGIRQALIEGATVEPGPIIAYLQRRVWKTLRGKRCLAISVRFRTRRPKKSARS